ncbi:MAG: nitrous oxide reductase family maturation protein NosD [Saprospiraceae bacterium]|nr:nitrous oxide reductase family maturation protein NosD [Saprospiraceae bacterium]MCB0573860.1 nitrous oxide reductase family maturation protein NosD [Saprospiraceae bacterium]MCB9307078.1 nitrous oxide reductase family maturation protein NosD [Lewinellaceae bacterium]MCB9353997.1 nitrous oxide reductase family maturation protein NosD [Lewinellaceae bacterium]
MKELCLLPALLFVVQLLPARSWDVNPHTGLQHIISQAKPFDTILVHEGVYREGGITIDKPLVLIGDARPVIDGEHKYQPISIRSSHVYMSGFRIVNCGITSLDDIAGIKIYNAREVYVSDNILDDNYFGIYLSNCVHCYVSGNYMTAHSSVEHNSGNGVHAWKCDSLVIQNNNMQGHRDGIYLEFATNSYIAYNHCEKNIRYGLHFMFSHNNTYAHNSFINNGAGVAVMYTRNVTMVHNVFAENRGGASYALLLKDIQSSYMADNIFRQNTIGIFMEGCTRSLLERNEFRQNGWAIKVQASCENNQFRHNNFFANTFDISTNNQLVFNVFDSNYWDKYEGYDLDRNRAGDVPYHPVSLFAMVSDQMPYAMLFWRSFTVLLLDRAEKVIPSLSPDRLRDNSPLMKPYDSVRSGQ